MSEDSGQPSASERLMAEQAELVGARAERGSFALADPDAWTLLLVELAALLAATRIDFTLEPGSATVIVEPNVLSRRDLDGLSSWAMVDDAEAGEDDRRRRARKQLALAYLALRARMTERVTIVAAQPEGPGCMLSFAAATERLGVLEGSRTSALRLFVEFGDRDSDRAERERALLVDRCSCSRVPVHIDGFAIARGWSRVFGDPTSHTPAQRAALVERPIVVDGRTIGVAGRHMSETDGAFLRVLINGVKIEDVPLDAPPGFRVIVEDSELCRDRPQGKLVRDRRFDAIAAILAEAHGCRPASTVDGHTPAAIERPQASRHFGVGGVTMLLGSIALLVGVALDRWLVAGLGVLVCALAILVFRERPRA